MTFSSFHVSLLIAIAIVPVLCMQPFREQFHSGFPGLPPLTVSLPPSALSAETAPEAVMQMYLCTVPVVVFFHGLHLL